MWWFILNRIGILHWEYEGGSCNYAIMAEVYTNGPVEVDFLVYEDSAHYKSGEDKMWSWVDGELRMELIIG